MNLKNLFKRKGNNKCHYLIGLTPEATRSLRGHCEPCESGAFLLTTSFKVGKPRIVFYKGHCEVCGKGEKE